MKEAWKETADERHFTRPLCGGVLSFAVTQPLRYRVAAAEIKLGVGASVEMGLSDDSEQRCCNLSRNCPWRLHVRI